MVADKPKRRKPLPIPDTLTTREVDGETVLVMLCHACEKWEVIGKMSAGLIGGLAGSEQFRARHSRCGLPTGDS